MQHFLSIKNKTKTLIYTELSYKTKLASSVMAITIYRPVTINIILFYLLFLLLVYSKLYPIRYIAYKKISNRFIIIKVIFLITVFVVGKQKMSVTNNKLLSVIDPNTLVKLNENATLVQKKKISLLLNEISEKFIKSIYKIEITSLVSIAISQLLLISIQPKSLLYFFSKSFINTSWESELNLVFTFSSQIYFLILDKVTKVIIALKVRTSNSSWNNLLLYKKIWEFFFIYNLRQNFNLKKEVMVSAQLNSSQLSKARYVDIKLNKILLYTNRILITFMTCMLCFLIST